MKKLKVAVVGVGGIAGAHMPGWKASEEAELAAGCDVNGEALAKWGAGQVDKPQQRGRSLAR